MSLFENKNLEIKKPEIDDYIGRGILITPLQKFSYKEKIIFVKREDLCGEYPAPPFSKLRGLIQYIENNSSPSLEWLGALEPSKNTMYGVGVAWAAKQMGIKSKIWYPKYKADIDIPYNAKKAEQLGAVVEGVKAGRTTIMFHQLKKIFKEKYGDKGFFLPNGLKDVTELIHATYNEVIRMDDDYFREEFSWIIACGTGTITTGVLMGIIEKAKRLNYIPEILIYLAFNRDKNQLLNRFRKFIPDINNYMNSISFINEGYETHSKTEHLRDIDFYPIPMNIDYELKAWNWLLKNPKLTSNNVVFWNMGSSLEEQEKIQGERNE